MKKPISAIMMLAAVSLTGCATQTQSTASRIEPSKPSFAYEKQINNKQGEVWDKLVKNMAKSFFVINNIDKESRIINLSYSSNRPQDYVDCGRSIRTFTEGKQTESYEYGITDNIVNYKVSPGASPDPKFSRVGLVSRTASLDGRANVYVAPENGGTLISVNAKSVVKIVMNGEVVVKNMMGAIVASQPFPASINDVTAVTKGGTDNTAAFGSKTETVTCYSTGKLEKDILELAI